METQESFRKVATVLIASGGGTDANAIMAAYRQRAIPNVYLKALISTKEGAGCLEKAKAWDIPGIVIDRKEAGSYIQFCRLLTAKLKELECELVFLVGCVVRIDPIKGMDMYNIHPADPHDFGGNGMYGLGVHERVLTSIEDQIRRGKRRVDDRFFTYPTVHEAVLEYDSGQPLLTASVEIPLWLIADRLAGKMTLSEAAAALQHHVLPYEWLLLPTAVRVAAQQILKRV